MQKQFTAGPLQIVRWANIINAHIFPGPAIIRALSEAAAGASQQLNSAVTTSISSDAIPKFLGKDDNGGSPAPLGRREGLDDMEDSYSNDDDDDDDDLRDSDDYDNENDYLSEERNRKPSVVSVSTTISTKTESISPQATNYASDGPSSPVALHHSQSKSEALQRLGQPPFLRSLLLLAEMSSAGNLMTGEYTKQCVIEARKFPDFVMGFISQRSLNEKPEDNFVTMTPGVQIGSTGDGLGQQYNTPEKVIQTGTDVIIVGRGVYGAENKRAAAEEYRKRAWAAYEARVGGRRV